MQKKSKVQSQTVPQIHLSIFFHGVYVIVD